MLVFPWEFPSPQTCSLCSVSSLMGSSFLLCLIVDLVSDAEWYYINWLKSQILYHIVFWHKNLVKFKCLHHFQNGCYEHKLWIHFLPKHWQFYALESACMYC